VTLESAAEVPTGALDDVVRTVTHNARALKVQAGSGFAEGEIDDPGPLHFATGIALLDCAARQEFMPAARQQRSRRCADGRCRKARATASRGC